MTVEPSLLPSMPNAEDHKRDSWSGTGAAVARDTWIFFSVAIFAAGAALLAHITDVWIWYVITFALTATWSVWAIYNALAPAGWNKSSFQTRGTRDLQDISADTSFVRNSASYGPNGEAVGAFLLQLTRLRSEDWVEVGRTFYSTRRSRMRYVEIQRMREAAGVWKACLERLSKTERDILLHSVAALQSSLVEGYQCEMLPIRPSSSAFEVAKIAGSALVFRNCITDEQWGRLYRPFAGVMPLEDM